MPKNSANQSTQRKTVRMDRKQFMVMMFLTPAFAAIVSVLLVLSVLLPLMTAKNQSLEIPSLGGETEEVETKEENKVTPEGSSDQATEEPSEVIIKTEIPATNTKVEEKKATKTTTSTKSTKNASTKTTTTKTTTNTTNTSAQTPKETAPSEKELCEARTDGPTTYIKVHFFNNLEKATVKVFSEVEDPVVDYEKWVAKDGTHAKMVYDGKNCIPSKTSDFEKIDDLILETKDFETYNITKTESYEVWQ